jgi:peptidoglycan/LPS O-acetylase OafA/YrhL
MRASVLRSPALGDALLQVSLTSVDGATPVKAGAAGIESASQPAEDFLFGVATPSPEIPGEEAPGFEVALTSTQIKSLSLGEVGSPGSLGSPGSPELAMLHSSACMDVRKDGPMSFWQEYTKLEDSPPPIDPSQVTVQVVDSPRQVDETSSNRPPDAEKNEAFVEFKRLDARPELDGLRAVCVIPVVLYHFKCNFPGGFAGVDVFFVISGYLVTAILLYELSVGTFSYTHFLVRRVRRLFPAMIALLTILLIVSWHRLLADTYNKLLKQTWAVIIFGANVHFYHQDDYFRVSFEEPLLHCWSLAVEEHYYFAMPLYLWACWWLSKHCSAKLHKARSSGNSRPHSANASNVTSASSNGFTATHVCSYGGVDELRPSRVSDDDGFELTLMPTTPPAQARHESGTGTEAEHSPDRGPNATYCPACCLESFGGAGSTRATHGGFAFIGCLVLTCVSLAVCIAFEPRAKNFAFYLLPTRAWEMLLGSLLAFDRRYGYLAFSRASNVITDVSSFCGLGMIVASFFIFSSETPWPSYPTLLPALGTVVFIASQEVHPSRKERLGWVGRFMSLPPLVFIGQLSYSLYLWHWPVYVLFAYTTVGYALDAGQTALGIFVSLFAAVGSLLFVESPFRKSAGSIAASVTNKLYLTKLTNLKFAGVAFSFWLGLLIFSVLASQHGIGGIKAGERVVISNQTDSGPVMRLVNATRVPTMRPTTDVPTTAIPTTLAPTSLPSWTPSGYPSLAPSLAPSDYPSLAPSQGPSVYPSRAPSRGPSGYPSLAPSHFPSQYPTGFPTTLAPSWTPSFMPTAASGAPTFAPTTESPTSDPTPAPTLRPSDFPTSFPSLWPSADPTESPSSAPSFVPTLPPTLWPTEYPSRYPTLWPSAEPTDFPTAFPSFQPTWWPSHQPTNQPTSFPVLAVTLYCMEWLNETQIDAKYAVPASLIFQSNILASPGWVEVNSLIDFDWETGTPANAPRLFGPQRQGSYPTIMLIGNSHMKMYGPSLRKLADEYQTQIGFVTKDGYWLDRIPWRDVGKLWRPRITMMADFWAGAYIAGIYSDTFFLESTFKDQINPKRQTAGPHEGGLTGTGPRIQRYA